LHCPSIRRGKLPFVSREAGYFSHR
jgi:hypothetical protein